MNHKYRGAPLIGWSPKEIVWLQAALTLPAYDFLLACEDIAGMNGRTVSAIRAKARALRQATAPYKPVCTKYPPAPKGTPAVFVEPPEAIPAIRQLTKAELMVGRAR